jgi:hypothetical protein
MGQSGRLVYFRHADDTEFQREQRNGMSVPERERRLKAGSAADCGRRDASNRPPDVPPQPFGQRLRQV